MMFWFLVSAQYVFDREHDLSLDVIDPKQAAGKTVLCDHESTLPTVKCISYFSSSIAGKPLSQTLSLCNTASLTDIG